MIREKSFNLIIREQGKQLYKVPLINKDGKVTMTTQTEKEKLVDPNILSFIEKLKISIFFLTDKRKILSKTSDQHQESSGIQHRMRYGLTEYESYEEDRIRYKESDELKTAIRDLEGWIRKKVLQGARLGERNTNTIYGEIVKRITKSRKKTANLLQKSIKLKEQLEEIRKSSLKYYNHGLISRVESKGIENVLENMQSDKATNYL